MITISLICNVNILKMRIKYVVDDVRVKFWFFPTGVRILNESTWNQQQSVATQYSQKSFNLQCYFFFLLSVYLFLFLAFDAVQYTYYTNVQWIVHIEFQSAIGFWNSINATVVERTSLRWSLYCRKQFRKLNRYLWTT